LIEFHRRDPENPGVSTVLGRVQESVMASAPSARTRPIADVVRARYASELMELAGADTTVAVKAAADAGLRELSGALESAGGDQAAWLRERIEDFLDAPADVNAPAIEAEALPPGGPIGFTPYETCWHCE
jgi:hypothetical protein